MEEITPEWLASFSVSSYQPMHVLLCEEDFSFLSRQPGFDLLLYKKFRRDRLRIFRQYMNRLIADYNRLHMAARMLLAGTPQDQSDMMTHLIRLKINFSASVLRAEANYLLCCVGFRTLAVRALIIRLEELSSEVAAISATQTI
ncbi:MAG TPA: hypothetical protein VMF91_20060 [Bryobacteraceae bacterium]|nr:hypothetical protein [Bryobacteraceae bacterium]